MNQVVRHKREKRVIFRIYQVVWYILAAIEFILAFRFIFRISGASPYSPFVSGIYSLSAPLIAPFKGIYPTLAINTSAFEWITLLAMIVWAIIAYAIVYIFQLVKPVDDQEVEETVDNP